uniref:Uncharacterized protein n=1 Tax=Zonotrichia albicollis TaxID=44394 RepID=A0A8D2MZI3_ZONAL
MCRVSAGLLLTEGKGSWVGAGPDLGSILLLQGRGPEENINYTSLVFPVKGPEPGSAQDYENVKSGLDYVNVDPKKRKTHFWPFSSPRASKGVEYTEVKL